MSTALQKQLSTLRSSNNVVQSSEIEKLSIFDDKDSQPVDKTSVYEAALFGIVQLSQYDLRFGHYKSCLFHRSSLEYQRSLCTKEDLLVLDKNIDNFLTLLSLWIKDHTCHVVLEFLIRIYKVNVYNVDSLLRCIIVYHDSKFFVKVLKLCKIENTNWRFLLGVQTNGIPCPRSVIRNCCVGSNWLLEEIADLVLSNLYSIGFGDPSIVSIDERANTAVTTMLSFYTAIVMEIADKVFADDVRLKRIFKIVYKAFQISDCCDKLSPVLLDWQSSGCVILSLLSRRMNFDDKIVSSLCSNMLSAFLFWRKRMISHDQRNKILTQIVMTLIVFSQQNQLKFNPTILHSIFSDNDDVDYLVKVLLQLKCKNSSLLASKIVGFVLEDIDCGLRIDSKFPSNILSYNVLRSCTFGVCKLIKNGLVSHSFVDKVISILSKLNENLESNQQHVIFLVRRVAYSLCQSLPNDIDSNAALSSLYNTVSSCEVSTCCDDLLLDLVHPLKTKRIEALKRFGSTTDPNLQMESEDIAKRLLAILEETDYEIASVVWDSKTIFKILTECNVTDFGSVLQRIILFWILDLEKTNSHHAYAMIKQILTVLADPLVFTLIIGTTTPIYFRVWLYSWLLTFYAGDFSSITVKSEVPSFRSVACSIFENNLFSLQLPFILKFVFLSNGEYHLKEGSIQFPFSDVVEKELEIMFSYLEESVCGVLLNTAVVVFLKLLEQILQISNGEIAISNIIRKVLKVIRKFATVKIFPSTLRSIRSFFVCYKNIFIAEYHLTMDFKSFVATTFNTFGEQDHQYLIFSTFATANNGSLFRMFEEGMDILYKKEFYGAVFCRMIFSNLCLNRNDALLTMGFEGLIALLSQLTKKSLPLSNFEKHFCRICFPLMLISCFSDSSIRVYSTLIAQHLNLLSREQLIDIFGSSTQHSVDGILQFLVAVINNESAIFIDCEHAMRNLLMMEEHSIVGNLLLEICLILEWQQLQLSNVLWRAISHCSTIKADIKVGELLGLLESCPTAANSNSDFQINQILRVIGSISSRDKEYKLFISDKVFGVLKSSLLSKNVEIFFGLIKLMQTDYFSQCRSVFEVNVAELILEFYMQYPIDSSFVETMFQFSRNPRNVISLLKKFMDLHEIVGITPVSKILLICDTVFPLLVDDYQLDKSELLCILLDLLKRNFEYSIEILMERIQLVVDVLSGSLTDSIMVERLTLMFTTRYIYDMEVLFSSLVPLNSELSQRCCCGVFQIFLKLFPSSANFIMTNMKNILCNSSVNKFATREILNLLKELCSCIGSQGLQVSAFQDIIQDFTMHVLTAFPSNQHEHILKAFLNETEDNFTRGLIIKSLLAVAHIFRSSNSFECMLSLTTQLFLSIKIDSQLFIMLEIFSSLKSLIKFALGVKSKSSEINIQINSLLDFCCRLRDGSSENNMAIDLSLQFFSFASTLFDSDQFQSSFGYSSTDASSHSGFYQSRLLEIGDLIVNILSLLEFHRKSLVNSTDMEVITFGGSNGKITMKSIMEVLIDTATTYLYSLQKFFDAATFYSILQILMGHKLLVVRQKSISMLRNRLNQASQNAPNASKDGIFLLELSDKLKIFVEEFLLMTIVVEADKLKFQDGKFALAQSAVMCLDTIAQCIGNHRSFNMSTLINFEQSVEWVSSIGKFLYGMDSRYRQSKWIDAKKLLATVVIYSCSLCRSLKLQCVPYVNNLTESMRISFASELTTWVNFSKLHGFEIRAALLLFRSLISSYCVLIDSLSSVIHQTLRDIIPLIFSIYVECEKVGKETEILEIREDVDRCLMIISRKLPCRVVLPNILMSLKQISSNCLSARRLASFVGTVMRSSDRVELLPQLNEWLQVCLSLIAFRISTSSCSSADQELEGLCSASIVDVALKLTENELKTLLVRIIEWRSASPDITEGILRSSSTYCVFNTLLLKLKNLSYPYIPYIWETLVRDFSNFNVPSNITKKRKRSFEDLSNATTFILLNTRLCAVTRQCSDYSLSEFMDEIHFGEISPKILELCLRRNLFEDDKSYLQYVQENISPTINKLFVRVNQDILWKPLNHQILLMTRNEIPSIKIAAISVLRNLFEEIGVDYLQLLPECLPFISELMEDDDKNVITAVNKAISCIEEVSGESFDSILQ